MEFDGWLPRAKGELRQDRRPWREIMTAEEQALARQKMAAGIAAYESRFGPIQAPAPPAARPIIRPNR
ncbi:MAG: hypothetical protein V1797_12925 [Pseudomonadota bacterium]